MLATSTHSLDRIIVGIGNEDLIVIEEADMAILSSHDRSTLMQHGGDFNQLPPGHLFAFDLKVSKSHHKLTHLHQPSINRFKIELNLNMSANCLLGMDRHNEVLN